MGGSLESMTQHNEMDNKSFSFESLKYFTPFKCFKNNCSDGFKFPNYNSLF